MYTDEELDGQIVKSNTVEELEKRNRMKTVHTQMKRVARISKNRRKRTKLTVNLYIIKRSLPKDEYVTLRSIKQCMRTGLSVKML